MLAEIFKKYIWESNSVAWQLNIFNSSSALSQSHSNKTSTLLESSDSKQHKQVQLPTSRQQDFQKKTKE